MEKLPKPPRPSIPGTLSRYGTHPRCLGLELHPPAPRCPSTSARPAQPLPGSCCGSPRAGGPCGLTATASRSASAHIPATRVRALTLAFPVDPLIRGSWGARALLPKAPVTSGWRDPGSFGGIVMFPTDGHTLRSRIASRNGSTATARTLCLPGLSSGPSKPPPGRLLPSASPSLPCSFYPHGCNTVARPPRVILAFLAEREPGKE